MFYSLDFEVYAFMCVIHTFNLIFGQHTVLFTYFTFELSNSVNTTQIQSLEILDIILNIK